MARKFPKNRNIYKATFEFNKTIKLNAMDIVISLMNKFGIKKLLQMISSWGVSETLYFQNNEEDFESGQRLCYLLYNWDKLKEPAIQHWKSTLEKAQKDYKKTV